MSELTTLIKTVEEISEALEVDPEEFKKKLHQSGLTATRDPQATKQKFQDNAKALDLKIDIYRRIIVKSPKQLEYTASVLAVKARILREFNTRGILKHSVERYMESRPQILGWEAENLKLRIALAEKTGLKDSEECHILHWRRWEAEDLLVEAFNHDPKDKIIHPHETELLELHAQKLFKSYNPEEKPAELTAV